MVTRLRPYLLIAPAVLVLSAFFLFPGMFNFGLSFSKISLFELRQGGTYIGLGNYIELLQDERFYLSLGNTVVWLTMGTVLVRLVLGFGLALLVNSPVLRRLRLAGVARGMLLIPWVTPPVVAVAAWKWLLHGRFGAVNQVLVDIGIINQGIPFLVQTSTVWFAIGIIIVWREVPFVSISILAGLQGIPTELYESVRVEGASSWQTFRFLTLPLLRPVVAITTMLTTIWTFNNFLYVWLTTRGGPGNFTQVLATEMYTQAFTNYRLGYGATIGVMMTLIMIVFAVIYFTRFSRKDLEL
ncbi:MAG: sugar ABC transporter permease [Spirochaeta sp.]|jgi:multiple sugar transport system permease protein|nr:sugar ABC transporter permease [Spirochaeta sp.]